MTCDPAFAAYGGLPRGLSAAAAAVLPRLGHYSGWRCVPARSVSSTAASARLDSTPSLLVRWIVGDYVPGPGRAALTAGTGAEASS